MTKEQFIKKYGPPPREGLAWVEFIEDTESLLTEYCRKQRDYDASFPNCELLSINKTVIELTENNRDEKNIMRI